MIKSVDLAITDFVSFEIILDVGSEVKKVKTDTTLTPLPDTVFTPFNKISDFPDHTIINIIGKICYDGKILPKT